MQDNKIKIKKTFNNVDYKFEKIGFKKVEEDNYGVSYERYNDTYGYIHRLELMHKSSGKHLILSFQKGINQNGFNNAVGLSMYEAKLCLKKMKNMGFKVKKMER